MDTLQQAFVTFGLFLIGPLLRSVPELTPNVATLNALKRRSGYGLCISRMATRSK